MIISLYLCFLFSMPIFMRCLTRQAPEIVAEERCIRKVQFISYLINQFIRMTK